jgi:hypothetical protein
MQMRYGFGSAVNALCKGIYLRIKGKQQPHHEIFSHLHQLTVLENVDMSILKISLAAPVKLPMNHVEGFN